MPNSVMEIIIALILIIYWGLKQTLQLYNFVKAPCVCTPWDIFLPVITYSHNVSGMLAQVYPRDRAAGGDIQTYTKSYSASDHAARFTLIPRRATTTYKYPTGRQILWCQGMWHRVTPLWPRFVYSYSTEGQNMMWKGHFTQVGSRLH